LDVSWTNYFTECKSKGRAYFKGKIQTGGASGGGGGKAGAQGATAPPAPPLAPPMTQTVADNFNRRQLTTV